MKGGFHKTLKRTWNVILIKEIHCCMVSKGIVRSSRKLLAKGFSGSIEVNIRLSDLTPLEGIFGQLGMLS